VNDKKKQKDDSNQEVVYAYNEALISGNMSFEPVTWDSAYGEWVIGEDVATKLINAGAKVAKMDEDGLYVDNKTGDYVTDRVGSYIKIDS
jgi:hypothetical protein